MSSPETGDSSQVVHCVVGAWNSCVTSVALSAEFAPDPFEQLRNVVLQPFNIAIDIGRDAKRVTLARRVLVNHTYRSHVSDG
jgi:hypothetical protein